MMLWYESFGFFSTAALRLLSPSQRFFTHDTIPYLTALVDVERVGERMEYSIREPSLRLLGRSWGQMYLYRRFRNQPTRGTAQIPGNRNGGAMVPHPLHHG